MNENVKYLINAVAKNDLKSAKKYVEIIIDADDTKSNFAFCSMVKNQLRSSSLNLMDLPADVQGILMMENTEFSFNEKRYFLSDRERGISDEVIGMYQTSQKLSEMGVPYLNTLMLYGESGTGKTLFGEYLANKLDVPFVYMNFANVVCSYLGSTSKNILKAFAFVEKQKCVFMLDEIDAIGLKRGNEDVGEMSRIVISLMQALDCVKNDVVIIGATNRIDMIDSALLRRFTLQHEVKKLSPSEMVSMVSKFLDDVKIPYVVNDIKSYCSSNVSQDVAINDVIRSIAKSVRFNTPFVLSSMAGQLEQEHQQRG